MRYILYIAYSYFAHLRKQNIVNIIALIATAGVTFGVMAMIIVLSVFNGFDQLVQDLFKNIDSDFQVELKEGTLFTIDDSLIHHISSIDGVNSVSKLLEQKMLAKYGTYQAVVGVKGVDEKFINVTNIKDEIFLGQYFFEKENFLVATSSVFNNLSLKLLDFDTPLKLSFFDPSNNLLNMNNIITKSFYLSGVFRGQAKLGSGDLILRLEDLQKFMKSNNKISALNISVKKKHRDNIQNKIQLVLGDRFVIKNRSQQRPFVNKMIKSEKLIVYIIFTFILLISLLSLVASLIVLLMQKQQDIQILFSLGLGVKSIKKIFLVIGLLITSSGLILGTILGLFFCFLQDQWHLIKLGSLNNTLINYYPIQIELEDILLIQLIVVLLGIFTAYIVTYNNRFYKF